MWDGSNTTASSCLAAPHYTPTTMCGVGNDNSANDKHNPATTNDDDHSRLVQCKLRSLGAWSKTQERNTQPPHNNKSLRATSGQTTSSQLAQFTGTREPACHGKPEFTCRGRGCERRQWPPICAVRWLEWRRCASSGCVLAASRVLVAVPEELQPR